VKVIAIAILAQAAALVAAAPASHAQQTAVTPVSNASQFATAISNAKSGDTIALADGSYPNLSVGRQFSGLVTIQGSRNAKLAGISFRNASNVKLTGVTVTPPGAERAKIALSRSNNITIDKVLVDGRVESSGAVIDPDPDNTNITIEDSEITNCGRKQRCIAPGAKNLRILRNSFHDCLDCDFIRGGGGDGTTIQGNTFDRAIPGACQGGATKCPHNDHVQLLGGGPWTIVGNRFGERAGGAASVFVSTGVNNTENRIHDVLIASNIFKGKETGHYGIVLGGSTGKGAGLPQRVSVINNTILSGFAAAINIREEWAALPPAQRPLIANNILRLAKKGICAAARTSHNVVEQGTACPGDTLGNPNLDSTGAPTKESRLLINHGDASHAPRTDFFGRARSGTPDIGAVEWLGLQSVSVAAPKSLVLHLRKLRAGKWKFTVRVSVPGATSLRARLVRRGKVLLTVDQVVQAAPSIPVSIRLPAAARKTGKLSLSLRAMAADGTSAARSVAIQIKR
jgi:hypothetical protein